MAKKGENIYKRKDGRYEGRYIKGRTPEGKAIYGSVYDKKYTGVKKKLIQLKSRYAFAAVKTESIKDSDATCEEYLLHWLEDIKKPIVKPATYVKCRGAIYGHMIESLGQKKLADLTSEDIEQFACGLQEKGLSAATIGSIYGILNSALIQAVTSQIIGSKPGRPTTLPKTEKKELHVLTKTEQEALEMAALEDKDGTGIVLALHTGMRSGEICALGWDNVDFEEGVIHVKQTVVRIPSYEENGKKTKVIFGPPKSENSLRKIPMSPGLSTYLRECKEQSNSEYVGKRYKTYSRATPFEIW